MNPSGSSKSSYHYTPVQRPASSLSNRPGSAISRPSSRLSHPRPASSLTVRPPSSASHRAQSRLSNRPQSRNSRTRILPHCQALVGQLIGVQDSESGEFRDAVEYAVKQLESTTISKPSANVDIGVIDRAISGHALKARINLSDKLAQGLEHCYKKLKDHIEQQGNDLDAAFVTNRLPDHLQLLIALSEPPSAVSLAYADVYIEHVKNPVPKGHTLTWKEIMAEEPFEGDHWEGILDSANRDWDSTPSLSPLNSDDLALDDNDSLPSVEEYAAYEPASSPEPPEPEERKHSQPLHTSEHLQAFEELKTRQYWRKEWRSDADPTRPFDLGDPSTLGPSIDRAAAHTRNAQLARNMLAPHKYINEEDMVREVLMALQGRQNVAFAWNNEEMQLSASAPRLVHLSEQSQISILASLGATATVLQHLRQYVAYIFSQSANQIQSAQVNPITPLKYPPTKTAEAFADAVDREVRKFEAWCADREEAICLAKCGGSDGCLVVSLLDTEQAIRHQYGDSFGVLLAIVQDVFGYPDGTSQGRIWRSPATLATSLLDTLFIHLQKHMERNDVVPGSTLLRVFLAASEPIWGLTGKWLTNGMNANIMAGGQNPGELEEEFFIEHSGIGVGMLSMGLLDPDFWKDGYSLREVSSELNGIRDIDSPGRQSVVPKFLEHVAKLILSTGKAIGLIRALGLPASTHGFVVWPSFATLVESKSCAISSTDGLGNIFSVSVDSLSGILADYLQESCQATGAFLAKLLVEECDLWNHVNAVEDLFLMRKGDAITHFLDVVFTKMDADQAWADFHFLNTAFGDVVLSNITPGVQRWIELSLVRLSFRGQRERERAINRTVKAIDGLSVEYTVPFPLTYIFRPDVIQVYSEIFVFLLQIRRAKHVLERILIRAENDRHQRLKEGLKIFYAMRSRLSWFTNTLLNFLTTYVLHVQTMKFHEVLKSAQSLDEIISLHDDHLDKIQGRCLLKPNTSAVHRAIVSTLDICLHFTELFVNFAGDTTATHDISRQSITLRHRSRKQRRHRRNVIGFAHSLRDVSSEDDDEEVDPAILDPPADTSVSLFNLSGVDDDGFFGKMEKISTEVDGLVRFIRRGVESLAGGTTEAAPTFGVLAFALEDWDL